MKSFKIFVSEAKKYSMKQAIDWFGSDEKDIAWTMSSKKRGEPLFGHWLDMTTGEVVAAKEKNPPKGVKVYKKESVEEMKNEELAGTSTADVVGTGDDVADWKDPKKKKKTKPLTRHFIEVGGKRRKLTK